MEKLGPSAKSSRLKVFTHFRVGQWPKPNPTLIYFGVEFIQIQNLKFYLVGVVNKSTRKLFEKKIAKALSNGSNATVQPSSGSSGEAVAPSEQTEPVQEKKDEPVPEDVPDGKFYSIKTDNENMIFKSRKSWDNKLTELR